MACPPLAFDTGFVGASLDFIDCQARTIGAGGYQALAAPGSIVSLALTGLLTLFVAGYGFRLILGEPPSVRDGVMAVAKVAFVLALATAWAPYRTLVYDVTLRGPAELTRAIGGPADLPGTAGDMAERLDLVDKALIQLNDLGSGRPGTGQQDMQNRQVVGGNQIIVEPAQGRANPFEPYALGLGRIFFLVGAVGAFGAVRLIAGLLLALGPLFVAFALFDSTRGLFEGWVRGLAGTFLGAIATTVVLASELGMIETWIAELLSRRLANETVSGAAIELVVVMVVFDVILIAALAASVRVATGFRLPAWPSLLQRGFQPERAAAPALVSGAALAGVPAEQRSRAAAVADGVAAVQRREAGASAPSAATGNGPSSGARRATIVASGSNLAAAPGPAGMAVVAPLGRSFQRRPRTRTSSSASRRDTRS